MSQISDLFSSRLFGDERHDAERLTPSLNKRSQAQEIVQKWRYKEKVKTSAVAMVLCLNIGVNPPDIIRISPCAKLQCWVDPSAMQPANKAMEQIVKNLQAQYERWQSKAQYKYCLDPTLEDVQKLCQFCRRKAGKERVLFHYNGHGVPRPTRNGEIWVFNQHFTQYIPLSIYELQMWMGTPSIYVFDCSAAGLILEYFKNALEQSGHHAADPMKDCIVLAACGSEELVPNHPQLPADIFTSCLTTPIMVALRWFIVHSRLGKEDNITKELIDKIPGKQSDKKTPLGELNWIFTAITDTIAWNVLPRPLFQKLFRQDLLVASLFRNFLLAERIMHFLGATPTSYPRLPPTHQHPMWHAWDTVAESCVLQLPKLSKDAEVDFQPSSFFTEQLSAFELWLQYGSSDSKPPEQLPIVLQVLLSQVHRLRALQLLGRFLDMGAWAVDLALSVGIFPYVLKLLQTTSTELRETLVFIWCKILALDRTCQVDLIKENNFVYFIRHLASNDSRISVQSRTEAAFILSVICDNHPKGQYLCGQSQHGPPYLPSLMEICSTQLPHAAQLVEQGKPFSKQYLKWLCLAVGKLCEDSVVNSFKGLVEGLPQLFFPLLGADDVEVRASSIYGLGCMIGGGDSTQAVGRGLDEDEIREEREQRMRMEREILWHLLMSTYDGSPLVRAELCIALSKFISGHAVFFKDALENKYRNRSNPCEEPQKGGSQPQNRPTSPRRRKLHAGYAAFTRNDSSDNKSSSEMESETGGYASVDAARVAQGIYDNLVDCICILAMDPAPLVSRWGQWAMQKGRFEVIPLAMGVDIPSARPLFSNRASSIGSSSPPEDGQGIKHFFQKLASKKSNASNSPGSTGTETPILERAFSQTSRVTQQIGGAKNLFAAYARQGYILKPLSEGSVPYGIERTASFDSAVMNNRSSRRGGGASPRTNDFMQLMEPPPPNGIPNSLIYGMSVEQFARPTRDPFKYLWRIQSQNSECMEWYRIPDPIELKQTVTQAEQVVQTTRTSIQFQVKQENVKSVDCTGCTTSMVAFHPTLPICCGLDKSGILRVINTTDFNILNKFSAVPTNRSPMATLLYPVVDTSSSLMIIGGGDGDVRVWRGYESQGGQGLATAWQAVGADLGSQRHVSRQPVQYHWSQSSKQLCAVGLSSPNHIFVWDMEKELCLSSFPVAKERLVSGKDGVINLCGDVREPQLLVSTCQDNKVRIYDIRQSHIAGALQPNPDAKGLVGSVYSPGGKPFRLVTGEVSGDVKFHDLRMISDSEGTYVKSSEIHSFRAHSKGLTMLAEHHHAPLLATVGGETVVKVWTSDGQQVAGVSKPSLQGFGHPRASPVVHLAFHPFQLMLGSAEKDKICTLYNISSKQVA